MTTLAATGGDAWNETNGELSKDRDFRQRSQTARKHPDLSHQGVLIES